MIISAWWLRTSSKLSGKSFLVTGGQKWNKTKQKNTLEVC